MGTLFHLLWAIKASMIFLAAVFFMLDSHHSVYIMIHIRIHFTKNILLILNIAFLDNVQLYKLSTFSNMVETDLPYRAERGYHETEAFPLSIGDTIKLQPISNYLY